MSVENGDNLRKRRIRLGLTQADLAGRLDVPSDTIAKWERGVIQARHWRMVFRALNDIADELAAETDNQRRHERNLRIRALAEDERVAGREP